MHRRQSVAQHDANRRDLRGREWAVLCNHVRQGAAAHELHPHAGASIEAGGAVDGDDVRVPDLREESSFFERFVCVGIGIERPAEQL